MHTKHNAHITQGRTVHGSNIVQYGPMVREPKKQTDPAVILIGTIIMIVVAFSIVVLAITYWASIVAFFKAVALVLGMVALVGLITLTHP